MNNNNTPRSPTLVESLLPILAMILLLGFGYVAFDLPPEPLMVLSTVIAALLVKRLGYGYNAILESISQKIAKTMPALLILISVGLLIGTWMIGGTIPLMIYYGLNLINPSMIYVTALLVTAIVSVCTGTSWDPQAPSVLRLWVWLSEWRLIWQQLQALLWQELTSGTNCLPFLVILT